MSRLEERQGEAKDAFRKAAQEQTSAKDQSQGRGDNTQHAGKGDGPGHSKGDEWDAGRKAMQEKGSLEKGGKIHDQALNRGPNKDKGPSL